MFKITSFGYVHVKSCCHYLQPSVSLVFKTSSFQARSKAKTTVRGFGGEHFVCMFSIPACDISLVSEKTKIKIQNFFEFHLVKQ